MKRPRTHDNSTVPAPAELRANSFDAELVLLSFPVAPPELPEILTEAEREVARLVYDGAKNGDIARARGVSVKTIGNQLESIYRKLRVGSRVELVLLLGNARTAAR